MTLRVQDVSFSYGKRAVLEGVTFEAKSGEVTAILGANAAGKSTLLKCISGRLRPRGSIALNDTEIARMSAHARAHAIGAMVQDSGEPARLTVMETVLLGRLHALTLKVAPAELERARTVLDRLRVGHLSARLLTELSGGQRRMVMLAQALAGDPKLLLLDEPTANLDLPNELEALRIVREMTAEKKLITVVTLHDLNMTARFADAVALMHEGRVIRAGCPEEALAPEAIEQAYGVKTRRVPDGDRFVIVPE